MDTTPPPPPYTESDTSSNFGILTPTTSTASATPFLHQPQSTPRSTSDSTSIVYTPAYSSSGSIHSHDTGALSSTRTASHSPICSPTGTSAAAYFEGRPFQGSVTPSPVLPYRITLSLSGRLMPGQFTFPEPAEEWSRREVSRVDWDTFLNHLISRLALKDNMAAGGEERGMDNEISERMGQMNISEERMTIRSGKGRDDGDDFRGTESAFRQARNERLHADSVIKQWNRGFFEPRGLLILVKIAQETSYGNDDAEMQLLRPTDQRGKSSRAERLKSRFMPRMDENSFKFAGIVANSNEFRLGKLLVADQKGLVMGGKYGISTDKEGKVMIGGKRGLVADSRGELSLFGKSFGGSKSGAGGSKEAYSRNDYGSSSGMPPPGLGEKHHAEYVRGRYDRHSYDNRHQTHTQRNGCNRSASTSSSSSSSSSSDSDMDSDCSLISVSKVKDPQLPIMKQSLSDWLNHPAHPPITVSVINRINHSVQNSNYDAKTSLQTDTNGLRREVQELTRNFKDLRKAQKAQRRLGKKERRAIRRAEKRERRAAKREGRAERREMRRGRREARREGRNESRHGRRRGGNSHPDPYFVQQQRLPNIAGLSSRNFSPQPGSSGLTQHGPGNQISMSADLGYPPPVPLRGQETGVVHFDDASVLFRPQGSRANSEMSTNQVVDLDGRDKEKRGY